MNNLLEKRMYFFVPYNLSPIQQGIQAGHASLEYAQHFFDSSLYEDFVVNWKTWIILNGGTTNNNVSRLGSMQQTVNSLCNYNEENPGTIINYSEFYEPDLNDTLTAICFIADEPVFNYDLFPDISKFFKDRIDKNTWFEIFRNSRDVDLCELRHQLPKVYTEWETSLGGSKNVFLRYLLKGKKLA